MPYELDRGLRYRAHWTKEENEGNALSINVIEQKRKERQARYAEIAEDYYDLTTDNYEIGWGPRFHFAPFPKPSESIDAALSRHDHFLALMMGLKRGMRGLDAGCGIGGTTREFAIFIPGIHITGISINKLHVERARFWAEKSGLTDQLDYVEADFMHIPFPDNTFDFVYAQEATVHAPNLTDCYTEIARVLKPGGVFGVYEWLVQHKFDDKNPKHVEIRQRIERGNGVTNLVTVADGVDAFRSSGLELCHHEDMALRNADEKPWWWMIDGDTSYATTWSDWWLIFRLKYGCYIFGLIVIWILEFTTIAKKGRYEALKTQGQSVYGMRDGAKAEIWTPMYMMVGRKPEDWTHPKGERTCTVDENDHGQV